MLADRRLLTITAAVVLLHIAALWALGHGLAKRPAEVTVPTVVIAEILGAAHTPANTSRARDDTRRANKETRQAAAPSPQPPPPEIRPSPTGDLPLPAARASVTPTPTAPSPASPSPAPAPTSQRPDTAPATTAGAAGLKAAATSLGAGNGANANIAASGAGAQAQVGAPPAASARIEMPSTDADYLRNPPPAYPPASKRMGEQGKVVVQVLIGADGSAQRAEIRQSSGFPRLDQAALATALKWRYLPGKRGGVPEAMWFNVPINFVLE